MENSIHHTAIIDSTATIGENVSIGPYSIIGPHVKIGDNTVLGPHVVIEARTIIGTHCEISSGAVIGGPPQDLAYKGEATRVRIGNFTKIRECVTINRASGEGTETVVGDHCFLMAYSHLAHNNQVGNHVIIANIVQVAGHAKIGDYAFLGGGSLVHQHTRIGKMAMLGGACRARQDIPPFATVDHEPTRVIGLNTIGLRRRGLTSSERQTLKKAFFYLWFSKLNQTQAIEVIHQKLEIDAHLQELLDFIHTSKRGIVGKNRDSAPMSDSEDDFEFENDTSEPNSVSV